MQQLFLVAFLFLSIATQSIAQPRAAAPRPFGLVDAGRVATIYYDPSDAELVGIAAGLFAQDIERVTDRLPETVTTLEGVAGPVVLIGTLGRSAVIDRLAAEHPELGAIRGGWERFAIKTVADPLPGIDEALVIAGSDRRGTAYGVFTLSEEIGVSPWYWWADAPVRKQQELILGEKRFVSRSPSVKYRGIFINDEAPALRGWAEEKFGGFNHQFYEKVFELILRHKGNYLWPAMWLPSAFATDDPENLRLADAYGIVISTTHHEPMMRAHAEWGPYGGGAWNYNTNKEQLREFWRGGIERMGDYESVVTLGMRGDGDEAMSEETAVELLQTIIADQRQIISDVTGKPAVATPQVWALYKEVQDYYDKGMRVAEDILLLFCDDNWGNVRILPQKDERDYPGGYGMYYHFDFVGGPVSYRWLNVTQIERVWEQMNLSYAWGVRDLWIVNVGDIKPMELPISFFLDFAWDVEGMRARDLPAYYVAWAEQQFGPEHAAEIGEILALYTKYNARRTPEMLSPDTYSLYHYREAERIVAEYRDLLARSEKIYEQLPASHRAAFYQLVLSPVALCSNLNEMYVAAGKNKLYAAQGRPAANDYADRVKAHFDRDAELTRYFHEELADGKWNHIMAQTHIGYRSWNNPPANAMPAVSYVHTPDAAGLGYALEYGLAPPGRGDGIVGGSLNGRSFAPFDPVNDQEYFLEIFNRGAAPFDYTVASREDWIQLSASAGTVRREDRVFVSIDWRKAPTGRVTGEIVLSGAGEQRVIRVPIRNDLPPVSGFVENNGVVSIDAAHYTEQSNSATASWIVVPNLGRQNSALTVEPADADPQTPESSAPWVAYEFTVFTAGDLTVETFLSPTLNYHKDEGLRYAIAIDDEAPQIINLHAGDVGPDWEYPDWWNNSVTDHIRKKRSVHRAIEPGTHTLKVWMVDPGVVFQHFVIDAGGRLPSYLAPPESTFVAP
jgi:hypothetical protein